MALRDVEECGWIEGTARGEGMVANASDVLMEPDMTAAMTATVKAPDDQDAADLRLLHPRRLSAEIIATSQQCCCVVEFISSPTI